MTLQLFSKWHIIKTHGIFVLLRKVLVNASSFYNSLDKWNISNLRRFNAVPILNFSICDLGYNITSPPTQLPYYTITLQPPHPLTQIYLFFSEITF